ncbi:MAG: HupE / UreJ protein [Sphingobacteriales bacterium 12-47-4]|nr:MAG: HupE / UreJ protein [Sphingobacteriales bacterium 12-47-4]
MQDFWIYFDMGKDHIADWKGYDHILFVLALCLRYTVADWKKVLVLVTAFTIGHSITLALSTLNYVDIPSDWIEFLIPVTILITALSNLGVKGFEFKSRFPLIYFFALFFGLIHGLGFSNYLKSILGKNDNLVADLLAFNLGLELGQLMIVALAMLFSWIFIQLFRVERRTYLLFVSGAVFGIALIMTLERIPW